MPIFEYKCSKCGHVTEFLLARPKSTKLTCEKCSSGDLQRLLSGFAVGQSKTSLPCDACPTCPMSQQGHSPQSCPRPCQM